MVEARSQTSGAGGFTLLELLIVITILGLIIAALTNGVRFATEAWQVQERRSARQSDFDAVQNLLRELITSGTSFEGGSASLRLVSELPEAFAHHGLYDVELHRGGDGLVLTWRPHFKEPASTASQNTAELIKNVTAFEFAYYIPPGEWQNFLKAGAKPPTLIKIKLQVQGRALSTLVFAPVIDFQHGPKTD